VWRAALNQEVGNIARLLAEPIVAQLCDVASSAASVAEVSRATALAIVQSKSSSLAADIARRAAIQCVGTKDRMAAFTERLFAETTGYLVSRDLPGFVGNGPVRTVVESTEYKNALIEHVAGLTRAIKPPASMDARVWSKYVDRVVQRLRGAE
jgi:hypothetical protein